MNSQRTSVRLRFLLKERDQREASQEEVLSVYRDLGVVPKSERDDNFNKTPEDLSNYKLVHPGDVVFNKMKAWQGSVAVSAYRGIVSGDYLVCEVIGQIDHRFLHHLLRSGPLINEYGQRSTGIRPSQWRLYWDDLADIRVSLPSLQDQALIAAYLDTEMTRLDSIALKKMHMIKLLEERRIAVTDSLILKEGGDTRPISTLATYVNGWPFKPDDLGMEGLPVVRIKQLVDPLAAMDYFNGELPESVCLKDGDLVFSWSGSLQVRFWQRGPAFLNQHLYRVLPRKDIDKLWLRFALDTATRLFEALMHGSAMTHITQPMMKDVRLPVPHESRQREIAQLLDHVWRYIEAAKVALNRQIELLTEYRRALITAAVMDELGIPVPEAVT